MSSQHEAAPPAPDDDDYSPEPTRHDRVLAELARRSELVAVEERSIAQAQARRAERLVELQDWSEESDVAVELHGNRNRRPQPGTPPRRPRIRRGRRRSPAGRTTRSLAAPW